MMLYLFHFCWVTLESPREQCCRQILVSTDTQVQPAYSPPRSPSLPPQLALSGASTLISLSVFHHHMKISLFLNSGKTIIQTIRGIQFAEIPFIFRLWIPRKRKKRTFLEVFCYIKAACQQQQQRCGSDVISTFSQQRSATHPKDNRWLLADFISRQRQEPEGKTNKSLQSLFALRNVTPTEHKQICSIKYLHQYA